MTERTFANAPDKTKRLITFSFVESRSYAEVEAKMQSR